MDSFTRLPALGADLYRRAPASVWTIGSLAVSYLVSLAYEDYLLYMSLGRGGLGRPSIWTWLLHTILLRPLAMPRRAATSQSSIPLDDAEWAARSEGRELLARLPQREGARPRTFGMVPHRQIEQTTKEGSGTQKKIVQHLESLAEQFPEDLSLAMSTYEATTSPSLFVRHGEQTKATSMARFFLSATPSPMRTLADDAPIATDKTMHEFAHIHLSEGSLHLVLAPQDARRVIAKGWGELHRLAGVAHRGHWFPPYWIPGWLYSVAGGEQEVRWSYQKRLLQNSKETLRSKLPPPTYVSLYAPKTEEQVNWTRMIIDASVAWAIGRSF